MLTYTGGAPADCPRWDDVSRRVADARMWFAGARAVLVPIDNVGDISNLVPRHTPGGKPRVSVGSKFSQGLTQIPAPDPLEEEKSFSADSSDLRVVTPLLGNVLRS